MASVILLDSTYCNIDAMACVDVKLFHRYIGAALPVFTRSHDCECCLSSLFPRHGAAIRDFKFGAELWLLSTVQGSQVFPGVLDFLESP